MPRDHTQESIDKLSKSVTASAKKRALAAMNVSADDYITTSEFIALVGNYSYFETLRRENKIPFAPLDSPSGSPKLWNRREAETFARRLHVLDEKAPAEKLTIEESMTALGRALIRQIREAISDEIAIQAQRYQTITPETSHHVETKPEPGTPALMVSRKEACAMLSCGLTTIMKLEKNSDWLVPIRWGQRVRYSRAAIVEHLRRVSQKEDRENLKSSPLPE